MSFLIVLVIVLNLNCIYSDICADINYGCDACLGNSFHCVWCTDEVHNDTRCRLERSPTVNSDWCKNIVNPLTETAEMIKNEDYGSKTETAAAVQLRPQHVGIKSRPRETVEFPMSYKPNLDSPIDVYYLFDNSKLAKLYKKHLDTHVPKIYEALREISGDVRFGIGSLDTTTVQGSDDKKIFRNILSFTEDISRFVGHETGSVISTLLQGLMEAVESEEINGTKDGRRTIVILFCDPRTSALDVNTSLQEDYEYINKIKKIVQNKHINIMFTGQKDFPDEYKDLAKNFLGASYVNVRNDIDEDHVQDFVNLIKDEYLKTVYNLELVFGVIPPHMSVEVTPACERFGSRCIRKVQAGTSLHMLVSVFMSQCPNDYMYNRTVTITAIGSHETLTIDIEALCYCKCKEKIEANSDKCNFMGGYTCGICICKEGRYGDSCECIGDEVEDGSRKCKKDPWDYICSEHGDCICGKCSCHEGYEGHLCGDVVVSH